MLRISFHSHTSVIVDSTGPLVVCLNFVEPAGKQFFDWKKQEMLEMNMYLHLWHWRKITSVFGKTSAILQNWNSEMGNEDKT